MDIPVIYLDTVGEDFTATTLLGDDSRCTTLHSLKRRDTEWLTHGWHYIYITILQALIYLLASHETREVETVGNTSFGCQINHLIHHIARTCHAETHVAGTMQYHVGCLYEILRTLLHGETTQEGYHLLLALMVWAWDVLPLLLQWIHRIVHGKALAWILVILVDHGLTGQLRYTHDAVGIIHTVLLDSIYGRVHLTTATVEIGSMYMDAQWLATHSLGMDTSRECQPVVGVDNIKFFATGYNASDDAVVVDLIVEIRWITAGKIHTAEVIHVHIVKVGIDVVTVAEIVIRIHDVAHTLLHIVMIDVAPGDRHTVHSHKFTCTAVLITERMRQTQCNIDISLGMQALGDTKVGSSQATKYVRRILPSKH